jgi:hypothetical protein
LLAIASSLPDKPEDITFLRTLTIVEPDNKLLVLGSVAGVLTTSVLLVALYARSFESSPLGPSPQPARCAGSCATSTAPQRRRASSLR